MKYPVLQRLPLFKLPTAVGGNASPSQPFLLSFKSLKIVNTKHVKALAVLLCTS
jgi:hypothetical protein